MFHLARHTVHAGRPWKQAAWWLLFLGPFFFASYGFANWLASQRHQVGSIVFEWEQHLPFLDWTIVPYWSIDLLYGLSLFVCATHNELRVHVKRLLAAQIISVTCFIIFPLQFIFVRPQTDAVYGWMFDVLMDFDKPFNQAPSLHIALLVLMWVRYGKHVTGAWQFVLHGWFTLIAISVLTTYQHHFVDLPTGLWVGWLCIWLFPEEGRSLLSSMALTGDPIRRRLALRYGAIALLLGGAAVLAGSWALWLLWPAGSLLLVAIVYACLGEEAFQKNADGSLSPAVWWLLAPYVLGAWANSRWWTRRTPQADPIVPGLLLGRVPTLKERNVLGVHSIVDVTAELPCNSCGIAYRAVPMLDLVTPSVQQLERAADAIEASISRGTVLVCCALGFSRSAIAVAAWLLRTRRAPSVADAIVQIRRARPAIVLRAHHATLMDEFARRAVG